MSDSHYVFPTLARRVLSLNLAPSGRFVRLANFCFKTLARINILSGNAIFCVLVHAGSNLHLLSQRDLEGAQNRFFKKCEFLSKTNGNLSKCSAYELLKHEIIQIQPRIISKMKSLKMAQLDQLPRTPK